MREASSRNPASIHIEHFGTSCVGVPIIEAIHLNFFYGLFHALKEVNLKIEERHVTALIGPSGCGKSTLVRLMNRMSDLAEGNRATGVLRILGRDIFDPRFDVTDLRRDVGMVFQQPNPFPFSVYDNLVFGHRIAGRTNPSQLGQIVEESLTAVDLWDDLKDSLHLPALSLSADFQQRLCIARAMSLEPQILLMDEPCSSLDPVATQKVEELILRLKKKYTIVIVTHSMQQAARISDSTGYMLLGELIEFGDTKQIFRNPTDQRTEDYISGKFG
ncbi:MAG: phosphate ABC transporter ATP-binding protein [Candidatus Riflebacteria bacterium]|nr:phosphate ABC transporter ATP-binding protein [Candidatus Riflebacteria bacterium]